MSEEINREVAIKFLQRLEKGDEPDELILRIPFSYAELEGKDNEQEIEKRLTQILTEIGIPSSWRDLGLLRGFSESLQSKGFVNNYIFDKKELEARAEMSWARAQGLKPRAEQASASATR